MKTLLATVALSFLIIGGLGCGLAGWHGDPPTDRFANVTGVMKSQDFSGQGTVWTIETDTASLVPESDLPSQLKQDSLGVEGSGIIKDSPDFYPEGYYFEVRALRPVDQ